MEIFREIFFTAPRARYGVFSSTLKGKMNSNECTKTFTNISETWNVAARSEKGRQVGESALDQDYKSQEPTVCSGIPSQRPRASASTSKHWEFCGVQPDSLTRQSCGSCELYYIQLGKL